MSKAAAKAARPVIGLDIGHSAVKIAAGGDMELFPSAVVPASQLSVAESAQRAKVDTVLVNDRNYWVGDTALTHSNGQALEGLRDDWIETDEHSALLSSGYQRGLRMLGNGGDPLLVLGLPSRLHQEYHHRLTEVAAMNLRIEKKQVKVVPQALGAYMASVLDDQGEPSRDVLSEKWGIIDVGYYTADFGLIMGGVWSSAGAKSFAGANRIAGELADSIKAKHNQELPLRTCDEILRTKSTKFFGSRVDLTEMVEQHCKDYARAVQEEALKVFGSSLAGLDGIMIAGGGADLVFPVLSKVWPHAATAKQPRHAVAEGMRRYGLMLTAE
jgi:plasmid segregation protein ParM